MTNRQTPPGRKSIACVVVVKPFGPHHRPTRLGSVHAPHTSSRGASKTRVMTISRSDVLDAGEAFALIHLLQIWEFVAGLFQSEGLRVLSPGRSPGYARPTASQPEGLGQTLAALQAALFFRPVSRGV